jgi:hypothetical protein
VRGYFACKMTGADAHAGPTLPPSTVERARAADSPLLRRVAHDSFEPLTPAENFLGTTPSRSVKLLHGKDHHHSVTPSSATTGSSILDKYLPRQPAIKTGVSGSAGAAYKFTPRMTSPTKRAATAMTAERLRPTSALGSSAAGSAAAASARDLLAKYLPKRPFPTAGTPIAARASSSSSQGSGGFLTPLMEAAGAVTPSAAECAAASRINQLQAEVNNTLVIGCREQSPVYALPEDWEEYFDLS